ncbi:hypothetical protein J6590_037904 [Homalodisca vitripennis]|nr:hypothetical protein J6590_037904 [Homalodisca vitripennis]
MGHPGDPSRTYLPIHKPTSSLPATEGPRKAFSEQHLPGMRVSYPSTEVPRGVEPSGSCTSYHVYGLHHSISITLRAFK